MLEILDVGSRGIVLLFFVAKTKALISCTVTTQVTCTFVFAYAKSRFSHDVALLMIIHHFLKEGYKEET